jgi:hypothetical protein
MTNHPFFRIAACFLLIGTLPGFQLMAQQKTFDNNNRIVLNWNDDLVSQISENESVKLLNFTGAMYDGSLHALPWFTRLQDHPLPGNEVEVLLKNEVYEVFKTGARVDLSLIGTTPELRAVNVTEKKQVRLGVSILPFRKNQSGTVERLTSFELEFRPKNESVLRTGGTSRVFASNSVLASGNWYKIAVNKTGIHRITADMLNQMGLNPSSVNPASLRLFGNGGGMLPALNSEFRHDDLEENAIFVSDGGTPGVFDGSDYILFYGQAPQQWKLNSANNRFEHHLHDYSDFTYYFLTPEVNTGTSPKRIVAQPSSAAPITYTTTSFDDHQYHDVDRLNFIKSGRQWYGEQFDVNLSQDFTFIFPNILLSEPVYIRSNVIAHSFQPSSFRVNYNGQTLFQQPIPAVGSSYTSDYAAENTSFGTFNATGGAITINLTYTPSTSTSVGYLNYLELNARRNLIMSGGQMSFRDRNSVGPGNVTQFQLTSSAPVQVWDVTDPTTAKVQGFESAGKFRAETEILKQYIAWDGSLFHTPVFAGVVPNQNLHAMGPKDMVIVSHPSFLTEAFRLAEFHRSQHNLRVALVTPEQVYNEFSSGARDIIAIRDFMKMFYDRAGSSADLPRYLLLFGDGSYDNKGTSQANTNFIPTYQSLNSISLVGSYTSDDYYGFLDDNEGDWDDNVPDLLDIGIGRFPVKNLTEAATVVQKTIDYVLPGNFTGDLQCADGNGSSLGDWRNTLCFIADDEDSGLHLNQSNSLANYLSVNHPVYNLDKIFIDAYTQVSTPGGQRYPTVNEAINRRLERGALVVNYTGHGGETGWTGERILDNSMIQSWNNNRKLPLFITATCEFSRYDDPGRTSAGELVLINSQAGGVALMSTTRLVYAAQNGVLNTVMINNLFEPINGQLPRLGDVYVMVKNNASVLGGGINPRNFSLLGDPAIRLAYPQYDVATTGLNGNAIIADADTLGALSKVTISGEIHSNGQKLNQFNGIIYPTVYDKEEIVSTLSNDPSSPIINFTLRKNILYKGKASVQNGSFSFTFIVPKDIAYKVGRGRLSYYAHNGTVDAHGYYDSLMIGGSSSNAVNDTEGPTVRLYMNDEKFVFGGTTDENPKIYALLVDSNGINTVGNGIGHDITATLNDDPDQIFILNDYYEADLDSYQSGKVMYPLLKLPSGRHTLKFKVWDIYNNSTDAYTEFVVAESAQLALTHVLNYPNPFTTQTSFFFEHNQACSNLDVQVQIYTVSGKLIKTINQTVHPEGFRVDDVRWDGRDDYGDRIGRGVYVYRLKVRTPEGATAEKFEKLVLLR